MPLPRHPRQTLHEANALIFGAFVFLVFSNVVFCLPRDLFRGGIDDWVYTDWLIDYSSGFVRRGLSGEVVRLLSIFMPVPVAVSLLIWGIFFVLAIAYLRLIGRSLDKINPIPLAGLLFLPSLLPFYLYDHGAFGRKETLGFLILLWHLYLLESHKADEAGVYIKKIIPVSMVALPIHLLIHEASLFQFVPVHLLISYSILRLDRSMSLRRRILTIGALYSPVFLTFLLIFLFGRPTLAVSVAICKHWESIGALPPGSSDPTGKDPAYPLPGAFAGLSWSFSQAASLSLSMSRWEVVYWSLLFSVLGFFTALIGSMVTSPSIGSSGMQSFDLGVFKDRRSQRLLLKYFLLPFLLSQPIYLMGWDLGRWFAVTCINYILIVLSREVVSAERQATSDPETKPTHAFSADDATTLSFWFYLNLAAFLFVLFYLRVPRCCIDEFKIVAEPLKLLLEELVKLHTH